MDPSLRVDISSLNVCPGWAVRQQAAASACEAHGAFEKNAFETFFPGKENIAMEAAMCLSRAYALQQLVQIRKT